MQPSSAEYWHMGATAMRLGSVMPPSLIGVNSWLMEYSVVVVVMVMPARELDLAVVARILGDGRGKRR